MKEILHFINITVAGKNLENAFVYYHPIFWIGSIVGGKRKSSSFSLSLLRCFNDWSSLELEIFVYRKGARTCKTNIFFENLKKNSFEYHGVSQIRFNLISPNNFY